MPWALCIFVLGSLIFIMGTIIKEMMQIQFLALNLWVCIMLDLNGFSSVSYQGILVKYLFFFQRKKKKNKQTLREENGYFSSFSFLEEVLWGQNEHKSGSWGRDVPPCVGRVLFLSSSTRPRQWEQQDTGSARRFSPSVNVSAGDNGALPGESQPWGQQLLLQGSSVYSNQKAERNADCQGETFLGWTLRPCSFLDWQATSVLP